MNKLNHTISSVVSAGTVFCCFEDALLEERVKVGKELLAVDVGTTRMKGATGGVVENFKQILKICLQIVDSQTANHHYFTQYLSLEVTNDLGNENIKSG